MRIDFKTGLPRAVENINQKLALLGNTAGLTRIMATTATALMRDRIHTQGLAADGSPIGKYSDGYMKVRTGDFGNSGKVSKGKNAGKLKDSGTFTASAARLNKKTGVFTGEEKIGKPRPRYNRSKDTTVVLSLTRQMENDLGICATDPIQIEGGYGVGYKNRENFEKAGFCEDTYNKKIFGLTNGEHDVMRQLINDHNNDALS